MRALIQRVTEASVKVNGISIGSIQRGLLILVGIEHADGDEDLVWLSNKIVNLRIFEDENAVMNKSLKDIHGEILVVSQFTLHADTKKGNRPSYIKAAPPNIAIPLYEKLKLQLSNDLEKTIVSGEFGADMKVSLINDGPVTIWIDTKNKS
ncbi:MAG: D-aminoacyl-tRNA deacylase [bacterium]|nr:D-aminoacyl-tRNA deacylase [bacterium]